MTPELSQVLLRDRDWIERCLMTVAAAPFGIEWASGRGALTVSLLERWNYLLGMELDFSFCRHLKQIIPAHKGAVICADINSYPLLKLDRPYPLVGNLPYHLTGPLLIKILAAGNRISRFQGLVQKEVAARLQAKPGDSKFGSLSLLFNVCGEIKVHFVVPATAFSPVPGVDSAWIDFIPRSNRYNFDKLKKFARQVFRWPRKTLLNNLAASVSNKETWRRHFEEQQLKETVRAHQLPVSKLMEVFSEWEKLL
ncbi:MAG: ribosomal RNA small subunit methyltransferase A [bacterium]